MPGQLPNIEFFLNSVSGTDGRLTVNTSKPGDVGKIFMILGHIIFKMFHSSQAAECHGPDLCDREGHGSRG